MNRLNLHRFAVIFVTVCLLTSCIEEALQSPFNYYRKAEYKEDAEVGDVEAMYEMGIAYCCGSAPFYDNRTGSRWLCRAARSGHAQAMADIAYWWRKDKGFFGPSLVHRLSTINDNAVAYAWYTKGAELGNETATQAMYEMEEEISPKEKDRAITYLRHFPDMPCEFN